MTCRNASLMTQVPRVSIINRRPWSGQFDVKCSMWLNKRLNAGGRGGGTNAEKGQTPAMYVSLLVFLLSCLADSFLPASG